MNRFIKTTFILFISLLFVSQGVNAQNPRKTKATIKTTAECAFCKQAIETKLSTLKGIRKVECDYVKHEVYVVYNVKKITLNEIRVFLSNLGYDADDVKANNSKTKDIKHTK